MDSQIKFLFQNKKKYDAPSSIKVQKMPERFEIAAIRHHRVGAKLLDAGETDDAAYHFGVGSENAIKYALRSCGLEQVWHDQGKRPHETPMRRHFPSLTALVLGAREDIVLYATGRLAENIQREVLDSNFPNRLSNWCIDIRYADDVYTPVTQPDCERWGNDLEHLINTLVL